MPDGKEMTGKGEDTTGGVCSVCGKPAIAKYKPFCSRRCADVDLHRWMGGTYRIPTEEPGFINDNDSSEEY